MHRLALSPGPALTQQPSFGISPNGGSGAYQGPAGVNGLPAPVQSLGQVQSLVCTIINWLFWGLMVLAVIMFLVAAYRYLTSSGEPEKVGKANKTLLYGAIAVVVGLLAGGIPLIIGSFFSTYVGGTCTAFGGLLGGIGL